jgi:hypothetical protein
VSGSASAVHTVDLATGVCTPRQPSSFNPRQPLVAARLPDGRIIFSSYDVWYHTHTVQVLGPPNPGSPNAASWQWTDLPSMIVARYDSSACVMSDGRFAVFGGYSSTSTLSSCEVLTLVGSDVRWNPLPSMHQARRGKPACAAIGGCVIVGSGVGSPTVEVYEEGLRQWRRLPCNLPDSAGKYWMGSASL